MQACITVIQLPLPVMQLCITVIQLPRLVMQACITGVQLPRLVMQTCITVIQRLPLVMQACITVIQLLRPVMQPCITVIQLLRPVMQPCITAKRWFAGHLRLLSSLHRLQMLTHPLAGRDRAHTGRAAGQRVRPCITGASGCRPCGSRLAGRLGSAGPPAARFRLRRVGYRRCNFAVRGCFLRVRGGGRGSARHAAFSSDG